MCVCVNCQYNTFINFEFFCVFFCVCFYFCGFKEKKNKSFSPPPFSKTQFAEWQKVFTISFFLLLQYPTMSATTTTTSTTTTSTTATSTFTTATRNANALMPPAQQPNEFTTTTRLPLQPLDLSMPRIIPVRPLPFPNDQEQLPPSASPRPPPPPPPPSPLSNYEESLDSDIDTDDLSSLVPGSLPSTPVSQQDIYSHIDVSPIPIPSTPSTRSNTPTPPPILINDDPRQPSVRALFQSPPPSRLERAVAIEHSIEPRPRSSFDLLAAEAFQLAHIARTGNLALRAEFQAVRQSMRDYYGGANANDLLAIQEGRINMDTLANVAEAASAAAATTTAGDQEDEPMVVETLANVVEAASASAAAATADEDQPMIVENATPPPPPMTWQLTTTTFLPQSLEKIHQVKIPASTLKTTPQCLT